MRSDRRTPVSGLPASPHLVKSWFRCRPVERNRPKSSPPRRMSTAITLTRVPHTMAFGIILAATNSGKRGCHTHKRFLSRFRDTAIYVGANKQIRPSTGVEKNKPYIVYSQARRKELLPPAVCDVYVNLPGWTVFRGGIRTYGRQLFQKPHPAGLFTFAIFIK